jgi:hypothetical protein
MPFGIPGFRTQIVIDGSAVAPAGAVLTGIQFRGDRPSLPLAAATVPNVTIALSHTNLAAGQLGTTFQGNVNGTPTVVFLGTVTLPAIGAANAGPLPANVDIQFPVPFPYSVAQGNLLLDIRGDNAPGGTPAWYLDAAQAGGSSTPFGTSGNQASGDSLRLIASTGNSLEPRLLVPGNFVDLTATMSFTSPPGLLLLGVQAFAVPLDLRPFGAPTHSVYVDPLAYVPLSWSQSFIGWFATVRVAVPNLPMFVDQLLFAQAGVFDATANAAGVATSHALETRIGDGLLAFPMQQLDATDPAAATGTLLDFGWSAPEYGAAVVRLEGVFF